MHLTNKMVLITGSSTGIGKEMAILFSKLGCNVAITYHTTKTEGEEVLAECQKYSDCLLVPLDITDGKSRHECIQTILGTFGVLDILINNAGHLVLKKLLLQTQQDIIQQLDVNLFGAIALTQEVLPLLQERPEALLINVASQGALQPFEDATVYCASKFGLRGFTQTLALELPKQIRTYCVNPGLTATKMTGFAGISSQDVAGVVALCAQERLNKRSGEDINIEEVLARRG